MIDNIVFVYDSQDSFFNPRHEVFNYCLHHHLDVAEGLRVMYSEFHRLKYRKLPYDNRLELSFELMKQHYFV